MKKNLHFYAKRELYERVMMSTRMEYEYGEIKQAYVDQDVRHTVYTQTHNFITKLPRNNSTHKSKVSIIIILFSIFLKKTVFPKRHIVFGRVLCKRIGSGRQKVSPTERRLNCFF